MDEKQTKQHLESVAKTWDRGAVRETPLSQQEQHVLGQGAKRYEVTAQIHYHGRTEERVVATRIVPTYDQEASKVNTFKPAI